ncbi:uncharacterized protein LOC143595068 [Bidens hawaiensis]|uniref:uncharacterized protein LOC143595068 n=1 Tax=Bidens hawaiensis TaxID=980011 RepID=UPI0040493003
MDPNNFDPPPRITNKFVMWKLRFKMYLYQIDYVLWISIEDGPYVPMTDNGGVAVPKEPSDYSDEDVKRMNVDRKAYALLTMALPNDIFRGLSHCKSAKELWDGVCERYEEIPEVLEKRKNLLIKQYEEFGYISGESMTQQFERFVSLVSELKTCYKYYDHGILLDKFMRSLPSCWRMHTTVMTNNKDFERMKLVQLLGHLKTYELEVNQGKEISQVAISSLNVTAKAVMYNIRLHAPPILFRNEFMMWKLRMRNYLYWVDYALWRSIIDGPYVPTTDNGGVAIPKEPSDYSDEDTKRIHADIKAHAILTMALPDVIFRGVMNCKSAKELWESLCKRYEDPPGVFKSKKGLLIRQYELFDYISGESMTQQFERFMLLVSALKFYGEYYENEVLLNKFMRSLPSHWRMYTMVMRNNKDFKKMTLIQLHGHLRTYELELNQGNKISQVGISSPTIDDLEERSGRSIDGNSLTMRFVVDKSKDACYKCQKTGHFARECSSDLQPYDYSFFYKELENAVMGNTERHCKGL